MPPPGLSRSDATLSTSSAPRMIVAGFQVRSPSLSVRHDVFLGAVDPVGEPVATAFGPGGRRHLVCAASLEQDTVSLGDLVDDPAHHLGVEELHRPATVAKPAAGVLCGTTGSLHHAVETHELAYDHSHRHISMPIEGPAVCVWTSYRNKTHRIVSRRLDTSPDRCDTPISTNPRRRDAAKSAPVLGARARPRG